MCSDSPKEKGAISVASASDRLLAALDLMEFGMEMMRQNLRRRNPQATSQFIDAELQRWLEEPNCYIAPEEKA